jgi:hypothetical protein
MEKVRTNKFREMSANQTSEPKRLSKAGQWMRDNPGGIIVVLDRRAVNK